MANELLDALTRHQVYLQRFGSHQANLFEPYLREADKIIRDVLSRYAEGIPTKKALGEINRELRQRLGPNYTEWTDELLADLKKLSGTEVAYNEKVLSKGVGADIVDPELSPVWTSTLTRPITTDTTARFMQAMLSDFSATEVQRVNQVVVSGFYEGKTTAEITRSIRGTKKNRYTDGILNTTSRNAGVVARTAVNHTATQARMGTLKANSKVIKEWEFSATLDNRTSSTCKGLHGTKWPIDEGPEPPRHFSCRSTILPVVPSLLDVFKGKERQASVGASGPKVVDAPDNYFDWLKTQPKYFQEQALGKTKTKLFRDGGLTTEEFRKLTINKYGDPLTLDEMRALDERAFEKADL